MPTTRRRHKRKTKKPAGLATVPRFMGKTLARNRYNQVSSRVFYFKTNGTISNTTTGIYQATFRVQDLVTNTPAGFLDTCRLYDEFKVLAMAVRWFPANVGIESDNILFGNLGLLRGDAIIWLDQRSPAIPPPIASISDKINFASCRMINPRRPQKRTIYRATGHPRWGGASNPGQLPDTWNGTVNLFGQNTTLLVPPATAVPLWYYTISYKVIFRGRSQP